MASAVKFDRTARFFIMNGLRIQLQSAIEHQIDRQIVMAYNLKLPFQTWPGFTPWGTYVMDDTAEGSKVADAFKEAFQHDDEKDALQHIRLRLIDLYWTMKTRGVKMTGVDAVMAESDSLAQLYHEYQEENAGLPGSVHLVPK